MEWKRELGSDAKRWPVWLTVFFLANLEGLNPLQNMIICEEWFGVSTESASERKFDLIWGEEITGQK